MESHEMYGVQETVPEFWYGTYVGGRLVHRRYEGHKRIIAAFANHHEAKKYIDDKVSVANKARTGGYMQIHEYWYRIETEVKYDILSIDVMPAVASCPS